MPAQAVPAIASCLLALAVLLAGCADTGGDKPATQGPVAADPAPVPRVTQAASAPRSYEPAPLPRIRVGTDRSAWNPTRNAHGWPDRFGGEPAGGPYRPRL